MKTVTSLDRPQIFVTTTCLIPIHPSRPTIRTYYFSTKLRIVAATYQTCGKLVEAVENSVENVWKILKTVKHNSLCLAIYDKGHR